MRPRRTHARTLLALALAALASAHLAATDARARQGTQARDYSKQQARQVRPWVRDAVVYEIFPRAFSPEGNFAGVTRQLDRLRDLGVTILWLMPIHPTGQERKKGTIGSPYAVRDYYAINPDYGTKEDFKRLVSEAHKRGMKVIIDIVANHTSWDSVLMSRPGFHTRDATGKVVPPVADWADVADLNYDNPALRAYMIDMLKFWLREYDLDGFRCDVAGFVPTDFWESARAELEKLKPDIVMLAEWDTPDLLVRAFDFDYAWPMHSALTDVLQGRRGASAIRATWEDERRKFPRGSLHMRFSDNHDERRAIARFGEQAALAASALVFTLDGVPMLYNGMEVGDTTESGAPALFERLPIFWQIAERRQEFPRTYKQLIKLRKTLSALRRGETMWLRNSDETRVVSFVRRDDVEEVVVVINLSGQPFTVTVEAPAGQFADFTPDARPPLTAEASPDERAARRGVAALPVVALDPWGYRIFRRPLR
ncbi:MAG TPA: alpha-amylase family glycosyl hydrolase [Pyrinomonadaceae bacterium]|nr:alpha-amylase family glycosyl hydrolase [Pyrinomonadaceae bacterium]